MRLKREKIKYLNPAIALLIISVLMLLYILPMRFELPRYFQFFEDLEAKLLDFRFLLRGGRYPGDELVLVVIDEKSIQRFGRWPWSRDKMGEMVRVLSNGGAKVIGFDIIFSEPEASESLRALRILKKSYEGPESDRFSKLIWEMESKADTDAQFAGAIKEAGNVILAIAFNVPTTKDKIKEKRPEEGEEYPEYLNKATYMVIKNLSVEKIFHPTEAAGVLPPLKELTEASNALGHVYILPDKDGVVRRQFLTLRHKDEYFPPLGVQIARTYLGLPVEDMKLLLGEGIKIGDIMIPTDEWGNILINYNGPEKTFPYYSASDLIEGKISPELFKGKIVIVGTAAIGTYDLRVTPFSGNMPGVEINANLIENILHKHFIQRTEKSKFVDLGFILFFGLVLGITLPRIRALQGSILAICLLSGYVILSQYLFTYQGLWINLIYPSSTILLTYTSITLVRFMTEEKKAKEMRSIFSSYVSPKVVAELIRDPDKARLGGERKEVSILFSDVRGFTSFSEKHAPEEVVAILNEYMTAMTEVIFRWDGTLDKFIGDAILVFWGAPIDQPDHAELAVRCALNMRARLTMLQEKWRGEGREPFDAGIGINTGEVIVGNMGAQGKKMDYTVIGDHVNLGARIESLTRKFDCNILISEFTYNHIKEMVNVDGPDPNQKQDAVRIISKLGHVAMRALESVNVKGREMPVLIYEIKGIKIGEKI